MIDLVQDLDTLFTNKNNLEEDITQSISDLIKDIKPQFTKNKSEQYLSKFKLEKNVGPFSAYQEGNILLINIDFCTERLQWAKANLEKGGFTKFQKLSAIYAKNMDKESFEMIVTNPKFHKGMIGCSLSHLRAMHYASKTETGALVFEDDIWLNTNKEKIPQLLKKIDETLKAKDKKKEVNFILLGNLRLKSNQESRDLLVPINEELIDNKGGSFWGTHALWIAPWAYQEILELFFPIDRAIDALIAYGVTLGKWKVWALKSSIYKQKETITGPFSSLCSKD